VQPKVNHDGFAGDQIVSNSAEHFREWEKTPRTWTSLISDLGFPQNYETQPTSVNIVTSIVRRCLYSPPFGPTFALPTAVLTTVASGGFLIKKV
jgi:hypothetical protein